MKKDLAIQQGTTMFEKTVKPASERKQILQSVYSNTKIGKGGNVITRGKWKGMPMYSLTLEERKTCPSNCSQWSSCYGNNSPFRIRVAIDDTFYEKLEKELTALNKKHQQGFVVRLHVLGDFTDLVYIRAWQGYLRLFKNLHVFGYTHQDMRQGMGYHIHKTNLIYKRRFKVRASDVDYTQFRANVEPKGKATGVICPEQTGKTMSCLTCGLCWGINKPITFLQH